MLSIVIKYYFTLNTGLYIIVYGIFLFFIQNRVNEIRQIVGISNSILYNYLNILPCKYCSNGYSFSSKTNDYQKVIESIRSEITSINKISLVNNRFSHMLHMVYCYYDDLKNNQKPCIDINFFDYNSFDSNGKSSAKLKFNHKLIKEIIKIY